MYFYFVCLCVCITLSSSEFSMYLRSLFKSFWIKTAKITQHDIRCFNTAVCMYCKSDLNLKHAITSRDLCQLSSYNNDEPNWQKTTWSASTTDVVSLAKPHMLMNGRLDEINMAVHRFVSVIIASLLINLILYMFV